VIKIETKEEVQVLNDIEALNFTIDSLHTLIKVNGSLLAKTNHKVLRLEEKVKELEVKLDSISKKPKENKQTIFKIEDTNKKR